MKVFHTKSNPDTIFIGVIFGLGLIGQSIANRFAKKLSLFSSEFSYSWEKPIEQKKELIEIKNYLLSLIKNKEQKPLKNIYLQVIWSAGKGGPQIEKEEAQKELSSYQNVLDFLIELTELCPPVVNFSVHLLSSAGGLFEGQRYIDSKAKPQPPRPYGEMNLEKEKRIKKLPHSIKKFIYRPSSVFGIADTKVRMGLISTILHNTFCHKVTLVFGGQTTLRDYVFNEDIARFIVDKALAPWQEQNTEPETYFLATGKPSSIFEIKNAIESILRRPTYLQYYKSFIESTDNTYMPEILPKGWNPTPIETALRIISSQLFHKLPHM